MSFKSIVLASVAGFAMAGAAGAATIHTTFDLAASYGSPDYGNQGNSFTETESGLTAEFSGNSFSSVTIDETTNLITSADVEKGEIHRWSSGAGVINSASDNSHTVDGSGWKDYIEISFSQDVMITEVNFSYFTAAKVQKSCSWHWGWTCNNTHVDDDDFRWMYDASGDGALGAGDWISANENANPFTSFGSVTTSVFGFGAFEWNDDWKLKSVSVKFDEVGDNQPQPVPLPAGGALLLGAIGGFAALRRRKSVGKT